MSQLHRLAARLIDQPLMVEKSFARTTAALLMPRLTGVPDIIVVSDGAAERLAMEVSSDQLGRAYERAGRLPLDVVDGIAVIPIKGALVDHGAWIGMDSCTGETSYQGLNAQILAATRAPGVKGIVYEIASPGGMVNGAFQTADLIRQSSEAKPTIAILTDYAYSAGYLLASQARTIVAPPTGGAGSIGVITAHVDVSRQVEAAGVTVTLITSGAHKADGSEFAPLSEDVRANLQTMVDMVRGQFAAAVGRGRKSRLNAAAALATEAQIYVGEGALKAGLIDAIDLPVDAYKAFVTSLKGK